MIVAGFGFRAGAGAASLRDAFARAAQGRPVAALATLADKADHPGLIEVAASLVLPVIAVSADAAAATETLTQSAAARRTRSTGSVAEAVALVAAGPGASLVGARCVSADRMATCALAERIDP